MHTVWKLVLSANADTYQVPRGSKPLHVETQHGEPAIWFLCDPSQPKEPQEIKIVGTGHNFESVHVSDYVGTFMIASGDFVFHVFWIHGEQS